MTLEISPAVLKAIHAHGEASYPEEGAGLLLGSVNGSSKQVLEIMPLTNSREDDARHNRYLLSAEDYMHAEQAAASRGLDVLGVFHSHPDHPSLPSVFDREWAMPWFSYIITSIQGGRAAESRSWLLQEDRLDFIEEAIQILE